jgi:hypothetical protein
LFQHTTIPSLEEIPVVPEFPHVFLVVLPGIPPNWDVEFTIELQLGMTPISRRPYKMTPKELAELKMQLKDSWIRVTFIRVFTFGLSSLVCEEERSIIESM